MMYPTYMGIALPVETSLKGLIRSQLNIPKEKFEPIFPGFFFYRQLKFMIASKHLILIDVEMR